MTVKQQIIHFIKLNGRVSKVQIQRQADNWHASPDSISRRCRELVEDGKLVRYLSERGTVMYGLADREQGSLFVTNEDFIKHYNPGNI